MSHEPLNPDARELAEDAAEWLSVLESGSSEDRAGFVVWLKKSPRHVEEILRMLELDAAVSALLPRKSVPGSRQEVVRKYLATNAVTDKGAPYLLPGELKTYRRAIVQILLQRSIDRDAAEDLFQELWLQVLEDSHIEAISDSTRLIGYLYRAARERVVAFHRDELSWVGGHSPSPTGIWQSEEPSALEESLGPRKLAQCARDLLFRAPASPDRKVLEGFFLHPQPDRSIRECLNLSDKDLGQILWRARQQFGQIVRERRVTLGDPMVEDARNVQRAALYVANALPSKEEERSFELQMMWNPRCSVEVDVWRALKRGMTHVDRRRATAACG